MSYKSLAFAVAAVWLCSLAWGQQQETVAPSSAQTTQASGAIKDNATARRKWLRQLYGSEITEGLKRRMLREIQRQRTLYPRQLAGVNTLTPGVPVWVSDGPAKEIYEQNGPFETYGTDSGRLRTILQDPTNANTVYVLTSGGGLWKSTNFGSATPTWAPLTDAIGTTSGGAAAFGRSAQTIFVGLGDPFDAFANVGGEMIMTANGGSTWSAPFNLTGANQVRDVKVDSSGAQDVVLVATNNGLWRSPDGGATYGQVGGGTGQPFAGSGVWSLAKTSAGWLAATRTETGTLTGSIYISTDVGLTWNPITNPGNIYSGAGRTTLAVGAPGDSVVYAYAAAAQASSELHQLDLFKSTDGGQSWTALNMNAKVATNPNADVPTMELAHNQAWYNQMILVDPADATRKTVYLGGALAAARTTDGGATWTLLSHWLGFYGLPYMHADYHCAVWGTVNGVKAMLVGNDGGLYYSTTYSKNPPTLTWNSTKNVGLVTDLLYSVVANPAIAGSELAEAQDNGTLVRSGSTSSFYQSYGGDGSGAAWAQATNGVSMASAEFDALVFNSGHNPPIAIFYWQDATNGLNLNDSDFFNALATPTAALDATGQVFYTCTTHYCYQTTNGGQSWGLILDAFTLFGLSVRDAQHSIGVSPIDTNHIAVAGAGGNLMLTINGGGGWSDVFMNGAVSGFQSFVSSPVWVNNSILYVGSAAPGGGAVRVAKSIDGGSTWSRMDSGLPDVAVMKLIVDPRDATGNTLYAGTLLGVYQTRNGGTSWQLYGSGLPIVQVSDIYMPANGTYMRVSTYGRGIWELPALTITTASLPAASLNTAYSQQLNATGGVPTYTWSISAGALPTGLTLSTSGLISGTPTVAGTYNFTVKVLDSSIKKQAATKALSIVVN